MLSCTQFEHHAEALEIGEKSTVKNVETKD